MVIALKIKHKPADITREQQQNAGGLCVEIQHGVLEELQSQDYKNMNLRNDIKITFFFFKSR